MIQQNTGEDWTDVDLNLSTATPSVGGSCPELKTKRVQFLAPPPSAKYLKMIVITPSSLLENWDDVDATSS